MEIIHVITQGVLLGGLYALFAAGLSLIFGVMRLVNIAHGDLIVVAAYMAYFTMQALGVGPFTSLVVVVPAIAVFGYALQRGLLNFALGDDLPPLLVTFGLSVIIQNVLLIFGFEAVIMGGLGSLWGTLAGGVLLGLAQAIGGQINVGLPFTAGHIAFLLVLIVRPQGLFP